MFPSGCRLGDVRLLDLRFNGLPEMNGNQSPFLVIGMGRGGTSLLAACFAGHPHVVMKNEFNTIQILLGDDFPLLSTTRLVDERLAAFRAICDEDASHHPGKAWGNKVTTEQIGGLEEHNMLNSPGIDTVERFFNALSGYRIVFITRNAASCIELKVRRTGQPFVRAAIRWCYGVRVFERLIELGGITCWCNYEELVVDPRTTLQRLSHSLGLDFDENMLAQTSNGLLMGEYQHGRFLAEKAHNLTRARTQRCRANRAMARPPGLLMLSRRTSMVGGTLRQRPGAPDSFSATSLSNGTPLIGLPPCGFATRRSAQRRTDPAGEPASHQTCP